VLVLGAMRRDQPAPAATIPPQESTES